MIVVKRWRNGGGNVTVEELESSLNLVCLLSQSMHPPVIGFRFTHRSLFFLMHMWVMELAALSLHVSRIIFKCQLFSQTAKEAGTCCDGAILCSCVMFLLHYNGVTFKPLGYLVFTISSQCCIARGN